MPPDWKSIRAARDDITDWVIHWTRRQRFEEVSESPFQVLQRILLCGYLKPTFAPRSFSTSPEYIAKKNNTIRGPKPAVCFTDQPLSAFIQTCKVLSNRYYPYGVALKKRNLFLYGGRPAIYGDKELLERLSDRDKYLWVSYNPIPDDTSNYSTDYPIDWTHEREWRARVKQYVFIDWGVTPDEGVPLILPPDRINNKFIISLPKILVKTLQEATELREWIARLPEYDGMNGFIKQLYMHFAKVPIIPLDVVDENLKAGNYGWGRVETLPINDIRQIQQAGNDH